MSPGRYTELFFLDEPTALAAGHRPCAECRRGDYNDFLRAFSLGQAASKMTAADMDAHLHNDRVQDGRQKTFECDLDDLPDGAMVDLAGLPVLWWGKQLIQWTPAGYTASVRRTSRKVKVVTPTATVAALRNGFCPRVHPSAG